MLHFPSVRTVGRRLQSRVRSVPGILVNGQRRRNACVVSRQSGGRPIELGLQQPSLLMFAICLKLFFQCLGVIDDGLRIETQSALQDFQNVGEMLHSAPMVHGNQFTTVYRIGKIGDKNSIIVDKMH